MCDCRKRIEEKLLERFTAQTPEAREHHVSLEGYVFVVVANTLEMKGCMPYKASASFPLKKGGEKDKATRANMIFTYCPFCGEKYPSRSEGAEASSNGAPNVP